MVYQKYRDTQWKSSLSECLTGISVVPFSEQIAAWACGRQTQRDTFNICSLKSPWTPSVAISALKTLKKSNSKKTALLWSELFHALENLPVYHGAKCSVEVQACSEFSSKGLEGIPGIANRQCWRPITAPPLLHGPGWAQGWQIGDSKCWVSHSLMGNPERCPGGLH